MVQGLVNVIVSGELSPGDSVNLFRFSWRELSLVAARLYRRPDFERAVELVADGTVPADVLISRIEPSDRAAVAFAALEAGGLMKVLLACQA